MADITIRFELNNAAFRLEEDDSRVDLQAVAEVVHKIGEDIELGKPLGNVWDGNGNIVGHYQILEQS